MARLWVGTCSWADHDPFYPPGLRSTEQISYYAQYFPIVEINSTYYHLQPRRNYEAWARRTPDGFLFDVKPYRQMTWHDREHPPDDAQSLAFRDTLEPLREAGKLGAVHFQFPPWYALNRRNLDYIRHVRELFDPDPVAVEFRHRSWLEGDHVPELVEALRDAGVGLTVVDEPQIGTGSVPTVLEVTRPDLVIVRFHGRNAATWYARTETTAQRFDYSYSPEELREWVPRTAALAERAQNVHLLFNNNARDYAVQNAQQLRQLLQQSLGAHTVVPPAGEQARLV